MQQSYNSLFCVILANLGLTLEAKFMAVVALIPAYNPSAELVEYATSVVKSGRFAQLVMVNDGSQVACQPIFEALAKLPGVTVRQHAINWGKGAALKTGFNHILCHYPDVTGIVTIDADGQHLLDDALSVAQALEQHPNNLVLGVREFKKDIPFRSWLGNTVTRLMMRWVAGIKTQDTQTGLRGIPLDFARRLLRVTANGYEFELDMLLLANRFSIALTEVPIQTVYIDDNTSSHFRPLIDSLKIYFVLFRFTIVALLSAVLDYFVFFAMLLFVTPKIWLCFVVGRLVSMAFNYIYVRRFAFLSHEGHRSAFPKYFALVIFSGAIAYALIHVMMTQLHMGALPAKLISEFIMYVINFLIQRDLIF